MLLYLVIFFEKLYFCGENFYSLYERTFIRLNLEKKYIHHNSFMRTLQLLYLSLSLSLSLTFHYLCGTLIEYYANIKARHNM